VGAPWLQVVLRDNAPDLWSVRKLVARIKPEAAEPGFEMRIPSTDHAGPSRGPDPELALSEANRLREKPGAELALARLLYRAGQGFAARNQWPEAVQAFSESLDIRQRVATPPEDVADAGYELGVALTQLSKYDLATAALSQARSISERAGDLLGSARSIRALGDVALRNADPMAASARYKEARELFRSLGDVLGWANCIAGVGDSSLRTGDHEAARMLYEQALALFRSVRSAQGEANCLSGLGDVALRRADLQTASARYQEALPLFRKVGDISGEAYCAARFRDIAVDRQDLEAASMWSQAEQALHRRMGDRQR
jgi:tetratricopeptide (TPR) repeat protein